jgi:hypothetical protein
MIILMMIIITIIIMNIMEIISSTLPRSTKTYVFFPVGSIMLCVFYTFQGRPFVQGDLVTVFSTRPIFPHLQRVIYPTRN